MCPAREGTAWRMGALRGGELGRGGEVHFCPLSHCCPSHPQGAQRVCPCLPQTPGPQSPFLFKDWKSEAKRSRGESRAQSQPLTAFPRFLGASQSGSPVFCPECPAGAHPVLGRGCPKSCLPPPTHCNSIPRSPAAHLRGGCGDLQAKPSTWLSQRLSGKQLHGRPLAPHTASLCSQ